MLGGAKLVSPEARPEPKQAASGVYDLVHHPLEHKICGDAIDQWAR